MEELTPELRELAQLYGLGLEYWDGLGIFRRTPAATVLRVLQALGAPLEDPAEAGDALRRRREDSASRVLRPVTVTWGEDDGILALEVRLPEDFAGALCPLRVGLDGGGELELLLGGSLVPMEEREEENGGRRWLRRTWVLDIEAPIGIHRLRLETPSGPHSAWWIKAPRTAHPGPGRRSWGGFLPVYALRTEGDWGAGGYPELRDLVEWLGAAGGGFVGTLPLFATFLDEPFAPSPYMPVSRLAWSEFYVDPRQDPAWEVCPRARARFEELEGSGELDRLRGERLVDYRRTMALKREVLELMSEEVRQAPQLEAAFRAYLAERPATVEYAQFRARFEREGRPWPRWTAATSTVTEAVEDPGVRYWAFTQWLADRQVDEVLASARREGAGLYLDLPLGVHPDGYDTFRNQELFVAGMSGGAPPDGFFTAGQNWGFPPPHPEVQRTTGYRYLREVLGFLMSHCELLRIDHAMSLQRLFWIPVGARAVDGVYVYYPLEEMLAVVAVESRRHGCVVVGEDLGTVTPELRRALEERGIYRMYVGQFEFGLDTDPPFRPPQPRMVASLNTHDTATAAGFWWGDDLRLRNELGLLAPEELERELRGRAEVRRAFFEALGLDGDPDAPEVVEQVIAAWYRWLGATEAEFLLINLEDVWAEREQQNVPGTTDEKPNWRRKCALTLAEMQQDRRVGDLLAAIRELRPRVAATAAGASGGDQNERA
ncbi:MAG: 4-alpha-glucanotransferase [Acidobacteriota bacterium]